MLQLIQNPNYIDNGYMDDRIDPCCSPVALNGLVYVRLEPNQNVTINDRIIPGLNGKGIKSQNNRGYRVIELRTQDVVRIFYHQYETALMKLG